MAQRWINREAAGLCIFFEESVPFLLNDSICPFLSCWISSLGAGHLWHIYRKLGVDSRTSAGVQALQREILPYECMHATCQLCVRGVANQRRYLNFP
jgi:hypothetical protein